MKMMTFMQAHVSAMQKQNISLQGDQKQQYIQQVMKMGGFNP